MTANDVADMFHVLVESVHTVIPATVLSVNGNRVKARPSLGIMLENGQKAMIPDLDEVPLLMLGSNNFSIELELSAGDPLILMVLEADARKWMAQEWKEPVEAASPARFGLGSCVAIPLCLADGKPKGKIAVAKDGTVVINGHLKVMP